MNVELNEKLSNVTISSDSDDYFEPSNFKFSGEKTDRKVTISEPVCKTNPHYKGGRRSRYSTFISGIHQFDPYQELTATQIAAFRQVFDLVDKDGGGSIDAEELYNSMKDLESNLNLDEVKEILEELDRDGNGEIDFEEFLYMMTSMSIQIKEAQVEDTACTRAGKRRQSVFFSVITKFAMKHSLKEIERYYASKGRYTPHVVGHYAAGARVDGLSDKELQQTWKNLSLASKGKNSPYAQPLNFALSYNDGQGFKKKTIRLKKKKKADRSEHVTPSPTPFQCRSTSCSPTSLTSSRRSSTKRSGSRSESKVGWTPRHRLPITKVGLPVVKFNQNRRFTIFDMDKIRVRINIARNSYYDKLNIENEEKAVNYWQTLKIDEIPSERLQENFKKVFRAYSPTAEYENHIKHDCTYGTLSPRKNKNHTKLDRVMKGKNLDL
ncbi:uncharacterized protein LOC130645543 [Hydractinia symbiolongicarpus]|uniref:uncharacterized protein LOC130645543 n=1 Tax=Hydractinia symbiolongicarpus TaxID=13093 RepID=UPI00254C94FE|nr:uncharacterized protein LOC130645543 [Hydractinia symbiolongicarpus]